jgi:hypothetical protein
MKLPYIVLLAAVFASCGKVDNYKQPDKSIKGLLTDSITGKGFQTQTDDNGVKIRMIDNSYTTHPTPWYFDTQLDGNFECKLVPNGKYNVTPLGAFVPLIQTDVNGDTVINRSWNLDINGAITQNYTVVPFLELKWVGSAVTNADNTITVQFQVDRGTTDPNYQQDVQNIYLYVNTSSNNVGDNNYDSRFTVAVANPNTLLGQVITVTTPVLPFKNANYYLRAGARINYSVEGTNRYNYTEPLTVKVP